MAQKIKIAVLGLGRIGMPQADTEITHYEDLFEIVAACDLIEDRRIKAHERHGCPVYEDYSEMLKQDGIEMVYIATRSCDHYKHAMMALEAGKHVVLEKPVTISYEQAIDLFAHANKEGTPRLYVHQQRRWEGGFNKVKEVVESGILGNVYEINIEQNGYQNRDDWQTLSEFGGGQLLNWGPHIIDHSLQLLGTPTADIQSYLHCIAAGGDCEDHLSIRFIGNNNRVVNMSISGAKILKGGRSFEVFGSRGAMTCNGGTYKLVYINPEQEWQTVVSSPETPGAAFGASGTYESAFKPDWIEEEGAIAPCPLHPYWKELYEDLREGKPFRVTDNDVLAIMRTISIVKAQNPHIMRFD
ncbi:MAG: Gfo/Idh/MocA family oxidoreductase [Ruminococcaceae bacterium]|nr:Gfo/Idh/MocA family oxidoreductase [Oscillospiraceae bacterium]